jgi:glutathione S-transferase
MRTLFFTTGSPSARAVRVALAEKALPFERDETYTTPGVEERAKVAPTLQVPLTEPSSVLLVKCSTARRARRLIAM